MKQFEPAKPIWKAGIALGLFASFGGSAAAQEGVGGIDQVPAVSESEAASPIEQVSSGTRDVVTPAAAEPRSAPPVRQLTAAGEGKAAPSQLTDAERATPPPVQLYKGGPTAQPPQALSHRSEGRRGPIDPVEGEDVCDPADEGEEQAKVCERVIETRSAEFVQPDPTILSPEQRLLIQQRLREAPATGVMRRLAKDGAADSLEGLGVASIVLNRPEPPREEEPADPARDPAADAAAAILEIIGQGATVTPPQ